MEARQVVNVSSSLADSQDLVIEVLSRLPIKSALRFISVSQEWYALIKSARFIVVHQKHLQRLNPNLCLLYGHIFKQTYDKLHKISRKSSYGTRRHRYLPQPLAFKGQKESTLDRPLLGFGFINNNSAEYKAVRFSRSMDPDADGKLPYLTQVFTRSENSWREVNNGVPPRDYLFESDSSISSNGVLYRLARTKSDRFVFLFDLHDEVVHTMSMPPRFSPSFRCIGQQLFYMGKFACDFNL
ncbi:hypothetical protein ACLB2K_049480 [Fragaria x ananassa]